MSILKSYRSKSFELTLERDPTSDSYTLFARDSFLDEIRKDPAFIQFMTEMKTAGKLPNLVERLSNQLAYSLKDFDLANTIKAGNLMKFVEWNGAIRCQPIAGQY